MALPDFPDYNKWGFSLVALNNDVYVTGRCQGCWVWGGGHQGVRMGGKDVGMGHWRGAGAALLSEQSPLLAPLLGGSGHWRGMPKNGYAQRGWPTCPVPP